MRELHPAKIDVAVLLLFFNRPSTFRLVFDEVRKARPSRLFLYQDGPRSDKDLQGIAECRAIAEQIDWECDVHRMYQEKNVGCDPSEYISQKWAFSIVDKCIVLEDDDQPSQAFFPFCKEMLDRYEHDDRISMVAGFNVDEVTPGVPYSYFFTSVCSIWGWASWRRVIDKWDGSYSFLDDEFACRQLESLIEARGVRSNFMKICRDHKASGKEYYESIFWAYMLMNNGLAVMPARNLISNVGATADSTHYGALQTMPRRLRRLFQMRHFEIEFPLVHPTHVMEYAEYKEHFYKVNCWGHPWIKIGRSMEELAYNLAEGNFSVIVRSLSRRINKWMGKEKFS